jgi:hypothetical protein
VSDNITLPREVVELALDALDYGGFLKKQQSITALRTALAAPRPEPRPSFADPEPSGYAYRYNDGVLRLNDGSQFNGGWPVEAVPYWFAPPDNEALRRDAERYRWLRGEHSRIDPCIKAVCKHPLQRQGHTWAEIHDLDAIFDAAMQKGDKT